MKHGKAATVWPCIRALAHKPFVRHAGATLFLRLAGVVIGVGTTFWAARYLGAAQYGTFAFLTAVFSFVGLFAVFGGDRMLIKAGKAASTLNEDFYRNVARMIGVGAFGTFVTLVTMPTIALARPGGSVEDMIYLLMVGVLFLPAFWASKAVGAFWRVQDRAVLAELSMSVVNKTGLMAVFFAVVVWDFSITDGRTAFFVSSIAMFGFYAFLSVPIFRTATFFPSGKRCNPSEYLTTLRSATGYAVLTMATPAIDLVPVIALGVLGRSEDAGILMIALKLFIPITIVNQSLNMAFLPRVASALNAGTLPERSAQALRLASLLSVLLVGAYAGLVWILGPHLLSWLGSEYEAATSLVLIMLAGKAAVALLGRNPMIIEMAGMPAIMSAFQVLGIGLFLVAICVNPGMNLFTVSLIYAVGIVLVAVCSAYFVRCRMRLALAVPDLFRQPFQAYRA